MTKKLSSSKSPENRGDRNPLTSRKLRRRLQEGRFVPKKQGASSRAGTEVNLPPAPKPEIPPQQPAQMPQPQPGDPVPVR